MKLTPETKLLIVNFPHNPTGALPSAEEFRAIMALARERGVRVFSDEMYRLLELDPKDRLPSACELADDAIVLFGMSKTFGLAGLRVGWLIVKDAAARERFAEYKDYTTICPATPSELLSLIGLRSRERILERHVARAKRNLDLLDGFFAKRAGLFAWSRPKAGTIGFARLLKGGAETYCAKARGAGVLLLPSTVYGWSKPAVRFGFGRENLPEALAALESA
jgi:aspartate/methionine/tyrosine aminotransferase